ncbi:MAG: beta-galactosidase, partial [Anaerolineales bacterium]
MNTDTHSLHELPINPPRTFIVPPVEAAVERGIPAVKPLELWAFLENSDFVRRKDGLLYRQDEVRLIRHDEFLEVDYQLLMEAGCVGVRDAAWWYRSHPAPGTYDWTWLDRVVVAAEKYNLKLYLDLWHYGYPDWMNILSP